MRLAVLVALIVAATIPAITHSEPARAASGACSITEAKRDVARAERRLAEARRVLVETRRATELYGAPVGRWVRLARRVGWRWDEIGTLMRVVYGESRGYPSATNGEYRGLMQHGAYWYSSYWIFDPYRPRDSLLYGRKLKRLCGWSQWTTW